MLLTDLKPAPVRSRMAVPDTALLALLGSRDESLRTAEELLDADVHVRGNEVTLSGTPADVAFAERVFGELISLAQRGQHVGTDTVRRTVEMLSDSGNVRRIGESPGEVLSQAILTRRGKTIRPKTPAEALRRRHRQEHDRLRHRPRRHRQDLPRHGDGRGGAQARGQPDHPHPARGRGGERLGFLPGTLYEKVDPYLRPLYDALNDMMDPEIQRLMATGTIEVAPLAYMRGRTPERRVRHPRRGAEHARPSR